MKRKILVAMSGGVDSSVAAAILKEAGHEVAGATIRTWASETCADLNTRACCGLSGVEDAREVAAALGIRYWVFNFEKEFKHFVVDHFAAEYLKGRTPNPCISCNEHVKFRLFFERAKQLGFDSIATGHYAQTAASEAGSIYLTEGKDPGKDQTYVLFPLDQEILKNLFLPVGGYTKAEIRSKAAQMNLCVAGKPDSQEICFIPSNDYGNFLKKEYTKDQPGIIRTRDGRILGEHNGYFYFTRGQRKGLGGGQAEKMYVVETIPATNEVIVGSKEEVLGFSCKAARVNWFLKPDFSKEVRAHVKIRSQHTKAPAVLSLEEEKVKVEFDEPQDAITPGQAAVFYDGPRVLGGGWIES